jgi:hypothetical protein
MKRKMLTPQELRQAGWDALAEKLGPADALRFLAEYGGGSGDYTRERRAWSDHASEEAVFAGLAAARRTSGRKRK